MAVVFVILAFTIWHLSPKKTTYIIHSTSPVATFVDTIKTYDSCESLCTYLSKKTIKVKVYKLDGTSCCQSNVIGFKLGPNLSSDTN